MRSPTLLFGILAALAHLASARPHGHHHGSGSGTSAAVETSTESVSSTTVSATESDSTTAYSTSSSDDASATESNSSTAYYTLSTEVALASATSTDTVSSVTTTSTAASTSTSTSTSTSSTSSLSLDATFLYSLDTMPSTSDADISTDSKLSVSESVYIVDMEGATADEIASWKSLGKTVICYFSAGSWEPDRSDASDFNAACYCGSDNVASSGTGCASSTNQLDGWDEWWLDIHSDSCIANVESVMSARIASAAAKGCDGIDPDNVDSYENDQNYGTTADDQTSYLMWLSETAKSNDLLIDLKNAGDLITTDLVAAFDFVVIESCREYDECSIYDPFLDAGKPQIQIEYDSSVTSCPDLEEGQNLLVYSGETLNIADITLSCSA